jgi:hypothetical protein
MKSTPFTDLMGENLVSRLSSMTPQQARQYLSSVDGLPKYLSLADTGISDDGMREIKQMKELYSTFLLEWEKNRCRRF